MKSNLNAAIDFSQNISKYWRAGNLNQRQRIQKLVFPGGIRIDTDKRQYLTSKVNCLVGEKRVFAGNTKDIKKGLPINSDEECSLVAGVVLPGLRPSEYHFGGALPKKA